MTKAIQTHATLNQRESLIRHHLRGRPSIDKVFDLSNAWELTEGLSIGSYKYLLKLSFNANIAEMKKVLLGMGFVEKKIIK